MPTLSEFASPTGSPPPCPPTPRPPSSTPASYHSGPTAAHSASRAVTRSPMPRPVTPPRPNWLGVPGPRLPRRAGSRDPGQHRRAPHCRLTARHTGPLAERVARLLDDVGCGGVAGGVCSQFDCVVALGSGTIRLLVVAVLKAYAARRVVVTDTAPSARPTSSAPPGPSRQSLRALGVRRARQGRHRRHQIAGLASDKVAP